MNAESIFRKQAFYRSRKMRMIRHSNQLFKLYNFVRERTNAIKKSRNYTSMICICFRQRNLAVYKVLQFLSKIH